MKKMIRRLRLISCIIAVSVFTMCFAGATEMSVQEERNQDEALAAFDKLAVFLGLDEIRDSYVYPDEYAGCFINEADELVICLTEITDELEQKYINICGNKIRFRISEYSMSDIIAINYTLEEYDDGAGKIRVGYNDEMNKLIVYIDSSDIESKDEICDYVNKNQISTYGLTNDYIDLASDILHFVVNEEDEETEVIEQNEIVREEYAVENYAIQKLKPGSLINNSKGNFTAGIWAVRNVAGQQSIGLITCAHPFYPNLAFDVSLSVVYAGSGNSELGIVKKDDTLYMKTPNRYDSAFITITNFQYQPTTELATGGTIPSLYKNVTVPTNTRAYISGQKTGLRSGIVTSRDAIVSTTISIGYYIETDNGSIQKGDSGAPVYIQLNNVKQLIGIQSDGIGSSNAYIAAVAANAVYAFDAFNATIYS